MHAFERATNEQRLRELRQWAAFEMQPEAVCVEEVEGEDAAKAEGQKVWIYKIPGAFL